MDVFIMSSEGGEARRLTFNSTSEIPSAFTPDGKQVVFSASIQDPAESALFPKSAMTELYQVPAEGGRTTQIIATPAEMAFGQVFPLPRPKGRGERMAQASYLIHYPRRMDV